MHKQAADSAASLPAAVFRVKYLQLPREHSGYFQSLCAAHILPATPLARYANYGATASEKDSAASLVGIVSILTKLNSLFWTVTR